MANEIDLVVGEVAFQKITELIKRLGDVDIAFGEIATKFSNLGKTSNPQSTAELAKLTAENQKLNKALTDLKASYVTIDTELAKNTKLITDATLATKAKTAADTLALKATEDQNSAYVKSAGLYANLDAQHKLAVKNAQDLAVETGRTGQKYEEAKNKANELGNRLKVIDTDIGKHTRNVGNYSSSWNGLGNSINQLTREAPAFANSVQTGFMALSNNIPILTDELGVLIQKNKDLQSEGKPTQSILKTVAGAFFSWQTAISLGVTILTVYGAKLIDAMFNTNGVKRATDSLTNSLKLQQTELDKNIKILEYNAEIEIELAKKRGASEKELLEIKKKLGVDTVSETEKQYNTLNARIDSFDKYRALREKDKGQALLFLRDKYNGDLEKATKEYQRREVAYTDANRKLLIDSKTKLYEQLKEKNDKNVLDELRGQNELNNKANKAEDKSSEERAKSEEERLKIHYETLLSDAERQKEIDSDILESFNGGIIEKTMLSAKFAADEVVIANLVFEEKKRLAKGDVELIKQATNEKKTAVENAGQEDIKRVSSFYSKYFKEVEKSIPKEIDFKIPGMFTKEQMKEAEDAEKERLAKLAQYKKEIESYLNSFGAEFASKAGLSETFNILSGNIAGFGDNAAVTFVAVAEAAQEMFNIIAESSAANYDAEYARLDAQKNEAIKNAGDSTAAKEKIDADYEKKKKEIQLREFKAKQKITIANIAIDTAQAIVSTYAQVPKYDYGVSATTLAFIIAGLGAAQIGMVMSQKPPAYADGTDNHSGGLMLVNDGAGSNFQEKVILPSGKVIRPQGRNVLMDAPKGTKVLNHEQQLFEMLQSNNISMSSQQASGLTYDEMNEIFQNNFANIKTQNTIFDKNGFQSYVRNGNSITRSNSNRSQAIGISV